MFTDPSLSLTLILTLNRRRCLNRPSPQTRWLAAPPPQRHVEPGNAFCIRHGPDMRFWPGAAIIHYINTHLEM